METNMEASGRATGREGVLIKCLLMGRRKGKEGGWEEGRAFKTAFETEKNGPKIQVAQCPKENVDAVFRPLQNSLFAEFVTNIWSEVLSLISRDI